MMENILFTFLIGPFCFIGFGWFFPIYGLTKLRDRIYGDPHGGSDGSTIEWMFVQGFAGFVSTVFFVWFYFNVSLTVFTISLLVWCLWSLICCLFVVSDISK